MTGLPANNIAWPPTNEIARYDRMRVASTWYGGDPDKLATLYTNGYGGAEVAQDGVLKKTVLAVRRFFWGTAPTLGERTTKVHVPVAEDIATLSSELLFSEGLSIRVDGPVEPEDVVDPADEEGKRLLKVKGQPTEETQKVQDRLEELIDKADLQALLLAAAETQSPLGSVALRVAWDKNIEPTMPFITRADADSVITEYSWGKLVSVTFWRVLSVKGETYVRHLERHERGKIFHGVYVGTLSNLGHQEPLAEHGLDFEVNAEGYIPVDDKYRFATSVPNRLPDPLDRLNSAGRSDLSPGVITMMDSIDEIATSLMRDIELGKGRLVVADYMLEDNGPGKGTTFNPETKIFSPLKMQPGDDGEAPITSVQFKIRVEEHIRAIEWFVNQALKAAGYNSDIERGTQGGDMTATEYSGKNKRSLSTRDKKITYWTNALEEILEALLAADAEQFHTPGIKPMPVVVEFPDAVQPDIKVLAETVKVMKDAEAASIQTLVQTLHPDWSVREVADEVELIQSEHSVVNPDTFGQSPQPPTIFPGLGGDPNVPQLPPVAPAPEQV